MRQQLAAYDDAPPIVLIGVGWRPKTFEPYVVAVFSESFPDDLKQHLNTILPTDKNAQSSSLADFNN